MANIRVYSTHLSRLKHSEGWISTPSFHFLLPTLRTKRLRVFVSPRIRFVRACTCSCPKVQHHLQTSSRIAHFSSLRCPSLVIAHR